MTADEDPADASQQDEARLRRARNLPSTQRDTAAVGQVRTEITTERWPRIVLFAAVALVAVGIVSVLPLTTAGEAVRLAVGGWIYIGLAVAAALAILIPRKK